MIENQGDHSHDGGFAADVLQSGGYQYTTPTRLSSVLANNRFTELILAAVDFDGRRVLDLGCGDGTYTRELADRGGAALVVGIDPVSEAVEVARQKHGSDRVEFHVAGAERLPYDDRSFDIVLLRGVLHHMREPLLGLAEALRAGRSVVVLEPNGYSPVLKVLEQVSPYHRAHKERSFAPREIERWVTLMGGRVLHRRFGNLVPVFCPAPLARVLKILEPAVERVPVLRAVSCGVFVVTAARSWEPPQSP